MFTNDFRFHKKCQTVVVKSLFIANVVDQLNFCQPVLKLFLCTKNSNVTLLKKAISTILSQLIVH